MKDDYDKAEEAIAHIKDLYDTISSYEDLEARWKEKEKLIKLLFEALRDWEDLEGMAYPKKTKELFESIKACGLEDMFNALPKTFHSEEPREGMSVDAYIRRAINEIDFYKS